jgi:hypothetical protein
MQLEADTASGLFILRTSNHRRWPDADAEAMMHRGWHDHYCNPSPAQTTTDLNQEGRNQGQFP